MKMLEWPGIRSVTTGDKRTNSGRGRTYYSRCWSKACPWSEGVWQPQTEAMFDIRIINLLVLGTTMLGRDWIKGLPLDWSTVHQVDGSVHSIEVNSSLKVL